MVEIGSSDAPIILGVSPHCTPWKLWAKMVGLLPDEEPETEVMSMGTALQDTVLREFCLRERWVIEKDQPSYHHRARHWQRATPDGLLLQYRKGEDQQTVALAEVKCFVGHAPDVPRVDHLIQCVHQRMVAESVEPEISEHYLVYFGGLRMTWFEVPKHQGAMDRILREEEIFLGRVEKQVPPPVSARDASVLNKAWPWAAEKLVDLPDTLVAEDDAIRISEEHIDHWTKVKDEAEANIKAALGDAIYGTLSNGTTYSWKPQPRKGYEVKPSRTRPFKRHGRKNDE